MVEWKKLGEIGEVCMCKRIMKEQTSGSGEIPFFKIGTFGAIADSFISKELFEDYKSRSLLSVKNSRNADAQRAGRVRVLK